MVPGMKTNKLNNLSSDIPLALLRIAAVAWEVAQDAAKREAEDESEQIEAVNEWLVESK